MKKIIAALPALALVILPLTASAHQHAEYRIGNATYSFVIGSLNEPMAVDDKSGVDFRVTRNDLPAGGLEQTLQVELISGDARKTLDLSPVFNTPGSYKAVFIPTQSGTLSYRFFGTINGTPVDLAFTCRAEGATVAEEGEKEISSGVRQLEKAGGFGCPEDKAPLGFPSAAVTEDDTAKSVENTRAMTAVALVLGIAAIVISGYALAKSRN